MVRRKMTEKDVSRSAGRAIRREYCGGGIRVWQREPIQRNRARPDMIVILEYQSQYRQWVVHTIESKVAKKYLVVSDLRKVCEGVKQARSYEGNYRWLAISQDVCRTLDDDELHNLVFDCKGTKRNTGLMVAYRTKADVYVDPGYYSGYFLGSYREEEEYVKAISV